MRTLEQMQASIAARNARYQAKREAAGLTEVRVTAPPGYADFIKALAVHGRAGQPLEQALAELLNIQRTPAPAAATQPVQPPPVAFPEIPAPPVIRPSAPTSQEVWAKVDAAMKRP